ncbi:hypothetical protein [Pedobacter sp. NJ-S-72]
MHFTKVKPIKVQDRVMEPEQLLETRVQLTAIPLPTIMVKAVLVLAVHLSL